MLYRGNTKNMVIFLDLVFKLLCFYIRNKLLEARKAWTLTTLFLFTLGFNLSKLNESTRILHDKTQDTLYAHRVA